MGFTELFPDPIGPINLEQSKFRYKYPPVLSNLRNQNSIHSQLVVFWYIAKWVQ